jgi:uncharacterized Tic20 family protein
MDEKSLAALAHALGIVTGFIGALVIYLMSEGKPFARSQAREALNFQITVGIACIAMVILWFVLMFLPIIGGLVGFVLWLALVVGNLAFCIIAAMAASKEQAYQYPFSLRLIKN